MRIGILSDTHKKVERSQQVIDHLLANGAEFLIHAGDIVRPEILQQLKDTGKRYLAVYGNNDAHLYDLHDKYQLVQEPHHFRLAGTKFKLMHLPFYMSPDAEVVIFGHTHIFECDFKNGTLYLNPGEACARNKPLSECAILEISTDYLDVTYFARPTEIDSFDARHFRFERS